MLESILNTVKDGCDISIMYGDDFDGRVLMYLNSVLAEMKQMHIIDEEYSYISGDTETWDWLEPNKDRQSMMKTYITVRVNEIFNSTSGTSGNAVRDALRRTIDSLEYRLRCEGGDF